MCRDALHVREKAASARAGDETYAEGPSCAAVTFTIDCGMMLIGFVCVSESVEPRETIDSRSDLWITEITENDSFL